MRRRIVTRAAALGLIACFASPATAFETISGDTVRLRWEPAPGDIHHYGIWLGTKTSGFPKTPIYTTREPNIQIPAIFLGNLHVRVAAFDARGKRGPFSPVSDPFRFLEADENAEEMTCQGQQLRALAQLCKESLRCEAEDLHRPDAERREGCISKKSFDFALEYEQSLARSDCRMTQSVQPVLDNVRQATDQVRALAAATPDATEVVMSAARLCRRSFRTERRYWRTFDSEKRLHRRERQRAIFLEATETAAHPGGDTAPIAALIDSLVDHWVDESRPLTPALGPGVLARNAAGGAPAFVSSP